VIANQLSRQRAPFASSSDALGEINIQATGSASGFSMGDSQKITIKTLLQRVPNLAPGLLKHQD